jgi:hypothetical protein
LPLRSLTVAMSGREMIRVAAFCTAFCSDEEEKTNVTIDKAD